MIKWGILFCGGDVMIGTDGMPDGTVNNFADFFNENIAKYIIFGISTILLVIIAINLYKVFKNHRV